MALSIDTIVEHLAVKTSKLMVKKVNLVTIEEKRDRMWYG